MKAMIYLLISVLLSVSMAIIIKAFSKYEPNMVAVTTSSYFASLLASVYLVKSNDLLYGFDISGFNGFFDNFWQVISTGNSFAGNESICYAIALGSVTGIFYLCGFLLLQINVRKSGVAITNIFMKGAVIIPLVFAFFVFKETLQVNHIAGIALCAVAIVLASLSTRDENMKYGNFLLLAFLVAGFVELASKLFQRYALVEHKDIYLLFIFASAFVFSTIVLMIKKSKITKLDIVVGLAISLPNLFTSYFLVLALNELRASIVYVLSSAGSIMLTLIFGKFIFREKLNSQQIIAILLTVISVIFINLA